MGLLNTELQAKKRITVIGAVVNLVLSAGKISCGLLGQSQALIADGFHSLSDLLTDALVYYASHHGSQDADEEHPYGHARFETLATVVLGSVLIAVAGVIIWDAAMRFFNPQTLSYGWFILAVAIISIASKEVMYHLTMTTAEETQSSLLKANAWHHRSDAISSFIVLIGVGLEMAGYKYFDSIAALVVGFMVVKIGFDLVLSASKELVDTALDADTVGRIKRVILDVKGVRELHFLRTRKMGELALVDVHILVAPMISVSEGHLISETVRLSLVERVENIGEVMVHIDPEDDEEVSPSLELPLREQLLVKLHDSWDGLPQKAQIKNINLHYLDGHVVIEVELPLEVGDSPQALQELSKAFAKAALKVNEVVKAKVLFS
ncbi:MAG: cation diffusion facilitator family transporter [Cycloclasticus sp. symbiont of Poecilosclerida sp. N]|nr:MAG: cation diffusion facilitator family transporter [Cycloclasticus sp. symbiont of Poecilosclerida sp. N]